MGWVVPQRKESGIDPMGGSREYARDVGKWGGE